MEKNKVESLVRELMGKLHMNNRELDDIMRCYTAKGHTIPMEINGIDGLLGKPEPEKEETKDDYPESAKMVYFPWIDVIGSMMEHHEEVHFLDEMCPDCGERLLGLEFWSPAWTWAELCGRSGPMTICLHCPKQIGFALHLMN